MAENTNIEWAHHTFNPWRGCTKVSAGCANCYAETLSKRNPRALGVWGPRGQRAIAADAYWRQPLKWDRDAAEAGERRRVFCASLADVFEGADTMPADAVEPVREARFRLFELIRRTPNLDWLLLTKRPQNVIEQLAHIRDQCPDDGQGSTAEFGDWISSWIDEDSPPRNVWLGTSVEDQAAANERVKRLLRCPATVHFLSGEPLLGPVDLTDLTWPEGPGFQHFNALSCDVGPDDDGDFGGRSIGWLIVGGESGPNARPMHPVWARSLRDQCQAAGVPFLFKQWGEHSPTATCKGDAFDIVMPGGWCRSGSGLAASQICHFCSSTQGGWPMARVGKKAAGRLLDGRTWDELPEVSHA